MIPTLGRVFDELPSGVCFLRGPSYVFEYFNPVYQSLVGGRAALGVTLEEIFPEVREQGFMDRLDGVYRTGVKLVAVEAPLVLVDEAGSANRFISYTYQAVKSSGGATEGILVLVIDVTDSVLARRAVEAISSQQQQDRFHLAIDSMLDAVLIAKPQSSDDGRVADFKIDYVNKAAHAEYSRHDIVAVGSLLTVVAWGMTEHLMVDLVRVVETGVAFSADGVVLRYTTSDIAHEVVLDVRASRVGTDLFLVWRDVTDRARREAQLRLTARRLLREQSAVHMLQEAILPRDMPNVVGVDIAAEYLPAHAEFAVGGDWYDVFIAPDGRLAASVGDVAGKGLEAAQAMGQLRAAGRAAIMSGADAAGALSTQNNLMIHSGWNTFATAAIIMLDVATGEMEWCSAGHLPILVVRSGQARYLDAKPQIALGVLPAPGYSANTDRIEVGDRFVLYTDGLIERRDEGLDDSLANFLRAAPTTGTAHDANVSMLSYEQIGSRQSDDVCILSVVRTADGVATPGAIRPVASSVHGGGTNRSVVQADGDLWERVSAFQHNPPGTRGWSAGVSVASAEPKSRASSGAVSPSNAGDVGVRG
jgi:PAS domain-containing protein